MKLLSASVFCVCLSLALSAIVQAEECKVPPVKISKELDRIKSLAGKWEGTSPEGPMVVDYRVTSGGTAVIETLAPGTPHKMISLYHDEGGKLVMTHYCMLGNQPKLDLVSEDDNRLIFSLDKKQSTIDSKHEMHMHSLAMSFPDSNTIVERWAGYNEGKESNIVVFQLNRVPVQR